MEPEFDFGGWATKVGLVCSDGRTIMRDAFKHQDQTTVPLVWRHDSREPENILGHVVLTNKDDGVYAQAKFNDHEKAKVAKTLVHHKDIKFLSIKANQLKERNRNVYGGDIIEVSLVEKGANPGAVIDNYGFQHGDQFVTDPEEANITTGIEIDTELEHADQESGGEQTLQEIYDGMSEVQKQATIAMIAEALRINAETNTAEHSSEDDSDNEDESTDDSVIEHNNGGSEVATHNVFEDEKTMTHDGVVGPSLTHAQINTIFETAQKVGSLKEAFLQHAGDYGIDNIDYLFPDAQKVRNTPDFVKRRTEWVEGVVNGTHKSPFNRIRSQSADITADDARAKGYVKGNRKTEEVFGIMQRTTEPQTIYKKQKLDKDDIDDIRDFDVVAWLKAEMRLMLLEEIARAILIGDGRPVQDPANPGQPNPDKIKADKIRPIATDDEFYTHAITVAPNTAPGAFEETVLRARKHYRGSGSPVFYTTEDVLTDLLLQKDKMGRRIHTDMASLASAMRVSGFVIVDVLEGFENAEGAGLLGVMVNISDYTIGAHNGGKTDFFDDFDIDYNQWKYLYETRMCGALTYPKSAIAFWRAVGDQATPLAPTFDSGTNTLTIPSVEGVDYFVDDEPVEAGNIIIEDDVLVSASPQEGYFFAPGTTNSWAFEFNADA